MQIPDGGGDKKINRGFFFLPETGEQVMIGFQQGDSSRPFVMGSLYHCKNTLGAAPKNNIKTIRTRSGHLVEFNDNEQEDWDISITDHAGNKIHLDTKENNIAIFSKGNISLEGENILLKATANIEMQADTNIRIDALDTLHIGAKNNIDISTDNNMQIKSVNAM
ncbi:MAG: phage baseplate assembly protein V [Tannerellaceae bacterium]|nr:phage baseplate assembly protein V [Tannerellaceae bacterium]